MWAERRLGFEGFAPAPPVALAAASACFVLRA